MFALAPPAPGWATAGTRRRPRGREPAERRASSGASPRRPRGTSRGSTSGRSGTSRTTRAILYPQSVNGRPVAPHIYREMVRAGGARPGARRRRRKPILFGELLPIGKSSTGPKRNLKPLRFLRSFFSRAQAAQRRLDGFAYHPYTRPGRAAAHRAARRTTPRSARYGRIGRVLDSARRAGPHRRRPPADLEHRVRLPDQPARPASGAASRGAAFWSSSELVLLSATGACNSISQYTMDDQARRPRASGRAACASRTAGRRRTCTTTTGCRSSCASSAPGPSRCAVTRDRPGAGAVGPGPAARPPRARSSTSAARSRSATSAATSGALPDLEGGRRHLPLHHRRTDQPHRQAGEHLPLIALNPTVTLRRIMTRLTRMPSPRPPALAGCGLAAAPREVRRRRPRGHRRAGRGHVHRPAVHAGRLQARRATSRSWNVALRSRSEAGWLDQWLDAARRPPARSR